MAVTRALATRPAWSCRVTVAVALILMNVMTPRFAEISTVRYALIRMARSIACKSIPVAHLILSKFHEKYIFLPILGDDCCARSARINLTSLLIVRLNCD